MKYTKGAELIAEERNRQIEKEGWDSEHDDHSGGALAVAGACYALNCESVISTRANESLRYHYEIESAKLWPWEKDWWKPTPEYPIKQLTKAGALIAAEIDRLLRLRGMKG